MKIIKVVFLVFIASTSLAAQSLQLSSLDFMISSKINSPQQETFEKVIQEEIGKRTGFDCERLTNWKNSKAVLAIALQGEKELFGRDLPKNADLKPEGFRLLLEKSESISIVWIIGVDTRGALFGLGKLLRTAEMTSGKISIPEKLDIVSSPELTLRGHQLGYRNTANSWDAWTVDQYEQYIRELALFGSNSIEDIPFQEKTPSPHMRYSRREMNINISEICNNYGLEYWIWAPATGNLGDTEVSRKELLVHEEFYKTVPRIDGVFFPGGDPGDNHPKDVMPHLEKMSTLLKKYHPEAGVWISLQGFDDEKVDYFFEYLYKNKPDWLVGVAHGPSSPEVDEERRRLPAKYKHRLYGDLTHTIRCQYPTENWDQAYALTLGREAPNPQPTYYTKVLREDAIFADGFLSYSDGVHDDVNKVIWNQIGWKLTTEVRDVLIEYCRFFFGPEVAEAAADGILALEKNWDGALIQNGSVEAALAYWKQLEFEHPELKDNWRWQLLLIRARYDAYARHRLIYEKSLEKQAYIVLEEAKTKGVEKVIAEAEDVLSQAETNPVSQQLKQEIVELSEALFNSIGLQSSVPKYQASGYERGCFMDFIDHPLNNRWWLEDEFEKVNNMDTDFEKLARIQQIINWENPGKGGFYDNISDISASPHVTSVTDDAIDYAWWDDGKSRKRLSTQLFQFSPVLEYSKLESDAQYLIRVSGFGEALLRANGTRLTPVKYEKELETFKEFMLPTELIKNGKLKLTFDRPDEAHLNWRKYSKVTEVWLIRQ